VVGYSGTPLPKKLGIKKGDRMAILRPPAGFHNYLGALPDGVAIRDRARGPLDVILFFVKRRSELERRFERLVGALEPAGALWIGRPRTQPGADSQPPERGVHWLTGY
jgi:hypothetical protein